MFIISRNCSAHDFAAKGKTVLPIRKLQRFEFFQSQQNIVKAYNSEICTAEFRCGTAKNRIFGFFRFDEQFIIAGSCGNFFQDVEYERMLEAVNKKLDSKIETVFLLSKPEYCHISSSLVRQLMDINIGIEDLVPNAENGIFKGMND